MDQFKLHTLIGHLLVDPEHYSVQDLKEHVISIRKAGVPFPSRIALNHAIRKETTKTLDEDLNQELRALFPWFRTGSGGK